MEREPLVVPVEHEAVARAVFDAGAQGGHSIGPGLVVFVRHHGFAEGLERRDARRDLLDRRAVPVQQQEVGGLGNFRMKTSVAVAAGGDEQAGRGFAREPDERGLSIGVANDGVCEALMRILVGDFQQHVLETALEHPPRDIHDPGANRRLIAQDGRLPLIIEAENDDHAAALAGADDSLGARQIIGPQAAVRIEG